MIPRSAREKGKQRAVESDERAPQPHQVMTGASAVGSLNLSISEGHQQRGTYTGDRQRPLSSTLRKVSGESDVPVQGVRHLIPISCLASIIHVYVECHV